MAGVLVVIVEGLTALSRADSLRNCVVLATLGAASQCWVLESGPSTLGFLGENGLISESYRVPSFPLEVVYPIPTIETRREAPNEGGAQNGLSSSLDLVGNQKYRQFQRSKTH